jgi:dTDP-glucose 4,6-dehydratase
MLLQLPPTDLDWIGERVGTRWQALRGQRLLLTGGTGFIGKWLLGSFLHANRSLGLGATVTVLSRDTAGFRARHPELADAREIEWLQGDVRDFELPAPCSFALHAATDVVAAATPSTIFDTCLRGTARVLAQVQDGGRALLLSSGAVYGRTPASLERIPEDYLGAPDPLLLSSAYGEGKRASELLCAVAAAERGLHIPIARCFAFVGAHLPLDKHFAIGNFIGAALRKQPLTISGDGTPLRSYLDAADLARWLWVLLFEGRSARAYNVGGDEALSIEQLAHRVVAALGSQSEVQVAQQAVPGAAAQKYLPELSRIATELGLRVEISLDEAIRRTARWHQEHS